MSNDTPLCKAPGNETAGIFELRGQRVLAAGVYSGLCLQSGSSIHLLSACVGELGCRWFGLRDSGFKWLTV